MCIRDRHEFVRGLRYLIPLAWIMLVGVLALFWPRMAAWLRVGLCVLAVLLMLLCNGDRQNVAALYSIAEHTGLPMPYMKMCIRDRGQGACHHYCGRFAGDGAGGSVQHGHRPAFRLAGSVFDHRGYGLLHCADFVATAADA